MKLTRLCGIFFVLLAALERSWSGLQGQFGQNRINVTSYLPSVSYVKNTAANADLETGTGEVREFALPPIQ